MEKRSITILGGGYAGVKAAQKLLKHYKKRDNIEIRLIDRNPYHTLMTELHEVAGARVERDSVRVQLKKIFAGSKLDLVMDSIESVDFKKKELKGKKALYPYDYLLIATGAEPCFFGVPGAEEYAFTLWSYEDAVAIREHTERMFLEASQSDDPEKRKQLLSFAVAGAGFTGIELAGELAERKKSLSRRYGIDPSEVRILIVEALGKVLPIMPEKLQNKTLRYLEKQGVEICLESRITEVRPDGFTTNNCDEHSAATFIWTCGVFGSSFGGELELEQGHCSRQRSDEYMRSNGKEDVFLAGDMVWFLEEEKPLPQIVETALQTAETAAENIAASIEGRTLKPFRSNYHGFMVSIGGKYAVSHNMGLSMSGFFAMALKHLINIHYLWGLAGFNTVWAYLRHEILDIKEHRSLVGGHLSWKIPGYWALMVRLWLGLMWIVEGANKIGEGWFNFSSGSKSGWMFSPGVRQAGTPAIETTSGASEGASDAAASTADALSAASGGDWSASGEAVSDAASSAAEAVTAASGGDWSSAEESANQAFEKIWDTSGSILDYNNPLVVWFRETFMDGLFSYLPFQAFQVMVVVSEIAIGLAIAGGFLTWIAAAASIALCIVFTLSGMFSWNQLWFVFAAVLLLGGGGRAIGLDHWLMPWIKKLWNKIPFVRKHHIFSSESD